MRLPVQKWTLFKPSLCKTCFATCCHDMPLEVSLPDLIRLGFVTQNEAIEDLSEIAKRLKKRKIIQKFHPRKMVFVIAQKKNKDCIFLDGNRRCTVYLKRPEICRQFPHIGPKPGSCPYLPSPHEKSWNPQALHLGEIQNRTLQRMFCRMLHFAGSCDCWRTVSFGFFKIWRSHWPSKKTRCSPEKEKNYSIFQSQDTTLCALPASQ